jgi:hypothetical protein
MRYRADRLSLCLVRPPHQGDLSVFTGAGRRRWQVQLRRQTVATETPGGSLVGNLQCAREIGTPESCPGSQEMGALHFEQNVFMVDLQFSLQRTIRWLGRISPAYRLPGSAGGGQAADHTYL